MFGKGGQDDEGSGDSTDQSPEDSQDQDSASAEQEPTPPPPTPAKIRIVNPHSVDWSYLLDGEVQNLPAEHVQESRQTCVIEFGRGGSAGTARYTLSDGTYTFIVTADGHWDLSRTEYKDASDHAATDHPAQDQAEDQAEQGASASGSATESGSDEE